MLTNVRRKEHFMRKITEKACEAFKNNEGLILNNTVITVGFDGTFMYLFGNLIAWKDVDGMYFNLCGWNTHTTRERLNGLLKTLDIKFRIVRRNGDAFAQSTVIDTAILDEMWLDEDSDYEVSYVTDHFNNVEQRIAKYYEERAV